MKRIGRMAAVALMLLLLSGCRTHSSTFDLVACGSFAVPGMFHYDLKEQQYLCEVLDRDTQGRVLFAYTTYCTITEEIETAIVICQASDSQKVCFYEDICYYWGEADTQKTALLKQQNDWGQPLDREKMAIRTYGVTLDLYLHSLANIDHSKLKAACSREFGVSETQIVETIFLDKDNYGNYLYWVVIKNSSQLEKIFIIINDDYEIAGMNAFETLEDTIYLPMFKKENGWGIK